MNDWDPVPERFAKNLANLTEHLKIDPTLDKILSEGIQLDEIRRNVRWLTGEGPSGIESRHSFTEGAVKAAHWIKRGYASHPTLTLQTRWSGQAQAATWRVSSRASPPTSSATTLP